MSEQTKRWWQARGSGPENHGPRRRCSHHWGSSGTRHPGVLAGGGFGGGAGGILLLLTSVAGLPEVEQAKEGAE